MNVILWGASPFRHSNNIQTHCLNTTCSKISSPKNFFKKISPAARVWKILATYGTEINNFLRLSSSMLADVVFFDILSWILNSYDNFMWTWLHKWIENFKVAFDDVKKYSRYIFRKVFKKYFHNVKIAARKLYLRECSYNEETS